MTEHVDQYAALDTQYVNVIHLILAAKKYINTYYDTMYLQYAEISDWQNTLWAHSATFLH